MPGPWSVTVRTARLPARAAGDGDRAALRGVAERVVDQRDEAAPHRRALGPHLERIRHGPAVQAGQRERDPPLRAQRREARDRLGGGRAQVDDVAVAGVGLAGRQQVVDDVGQAGAVGRAAGRRPPASNRRLSSSRSAASMRRRSTCARVESTVSGVRSS